jgi:O-acetyl-ADP-ribose deacetylase (regulator of RNase III)
MNGQVEKWTNPSVKMLAGDNDPVRTITDRAREVVLMAIDKGWAGPPFDPLALGDLLNLRTAPRADIRDARTVPEGDGVCIEYNPSRPRGRARYSIAHEIAHTLFPDCSDQIRNRASRHEMKADDWQVEMLCNIAAAEFLMPIGSLGAVRQEDLNIDRILELRKEYDVSTEAVLLRAVHVTDAPCAVFSASRIEEGPNEGRYFVEYVIPSRDWNLPISKHAVLPSPHVIGKCSGIGFTAKGSEKIGTETLHTECVGIPPYPGSSFPRIAGILTSESRPQIGPRITFLKGDATRPLANGKRIIAHVVNDATPNWGGHGFAQAIKTKWPAAQEAFRKWVAEDPERLSLGNLHLADVDSETALASLICQRGYGSSAKLRLRYFALEACLRNLHQIASERLASVHMPRIGCGQAGGSWFLVQELIAGVLLSENVPVFVYDLPDAKERFRGQHSLEL